MKIFLVLLVLLIVGCKNDPPVQAKVLGEDVGTDQLVAANKEAVRAEQRDIENYLRRHGIEATRSGTGLYYYFFEDLPGKLIVPDQEVLIEHRVSLLNGKECYRTPVGKPESFIVEYADVERGLHEGIQYMSPGDSALLVIPSYLAHGLAGDQDKIPMRSTIVYNIRLLDVR